MNFAKFTTEQTGPKDSVLFFKNDRLYFESFEIDFENRPDNLLQYLDSSQKTYTYSDEMIMINDISFCGLTCDVYILYSDNEIERIMLNPEDIQIASNVYADPELIQKRTMFNMKLSLEQTMHDKEILGEETVYHIGDFNVIPRMMDEAVILITHFKRQTVQFPEVVKNKNTIMERNILPLYKQESGLDDKDERKRLIFMGHDAVIELKKARLMLKDAQKRSTAALMLNGMIGMAVNAQKRDKIANANKALMVAQASVKRFYNELHQVSSMPNIQINYGQTRGILEMLSGNPLMESFTHFDILSAIRQVDKLANKLEQMIKEL